MKNEKKIKELYDCEYIVSDEGLYPLQEWHNKLIDKTISDITVADVTRMIRQKEYIELAMVKAIKFLQDDVFAGDMWEGELLEHMLKVDTPFLAAYLDELHGVLKDAQDKMETHEWLCDEERKEFQETVVSVLKKLMK